MKGYLIELRNKNNPNKPVGSGSLDSSASPEQRYQMAKKILSKITPGDYIVIEYNADWTVCSNPEFTMIKQYNMNEYLNDSYTPSGVTEQLDTIYPNLDYSYGIEPVVKQPDLVGNRSEVTKTTTTDIHISYNDEELGVTPPPGS